MDTRYFDVLQFAFHFSSLIIFYILKYTSYVYYRSIIVHEIMSYMMNITSFVRQ